MEFVTGTFNGLDLLGMVAVVLLGWFAAYAHRRSREAPLDRESGGA